MNSRISKKAVLVIGAAAAVASVTATVVNPAAAMSANNGPALVPMVGSVPSWAATPPVGTVPIDQHRTIRVALPLRNPDGAERLATTVSTPGSPQYGHYETAAQFTQQFAPSPHTVADVRGWLTSQGLAVQSVSANRTQITVTGTVDQMQRAFATTLSLHQVDGRRLAAPNSPVKMPQRLAGEISGVFGLDDTAELLHPLHTPVQPRPQATSTYCSRWWDDQNNTKVPQKYGSDGQSNALCGYKVAQTRGIYGLSPAQSGAGQSIALVGAYNDATIPSDVARWAPTAGTTPLVPGQYAVVGSHFDQPPNCEGPQAWSTEQILDVEATHSMAPAARLTWYAARDCNDLDNALNTAISDDKASVISDSWGSPGESTVTPAERNTVTTMLVQAAIQGQSVLFASGDTGDDSATDPHGTPSFPASNPWATAVGGTTVAAGPAGQVQFTTG
ncbi:MAG: hypothetical protein J2P17_19085, partial [Mycobacterium sp.]|nr:hypothetical protein [Mycobacterium sp.]